MASQTWEQLLTDTGYLSRPTDPDPIHASDPGVSLVALSVCLMYDPDKMIMGQTVPSEEANSIGVGAHQVVFPSEKGMLLQRCLDMVQGSGNCFCCAKIVRVPVAMVDGSSRVASRMDFEGGEVPVIIHSVGEPVFSTWNGYRAKELKLK